MICKTHFKIWKSFSVFLLIFFFSISNQTKAQSVPYQYDKTELKLNADFIAYGQHPRALNQSVKLSVLKDFLALHANEELYILIDYPIGLNEYINTNPHKIDFSILEKQLYNYYQSKSYIDLQLQKIKGITELVKKHHSVIIKCVGVHPSVKNYDSLVYLNIKHIINENFRKTFFITSPQNTLKYYYHDESFNGNKLTSLAMLNVDTLFHNKTITSIAEASRFIENINNQGLIKSIGYTGLRNYQRDRVNLIPYKNENFVCIDLWEYLAENNLSFDYLILFNEMPFNK